MSTWHRALRSQMAVEVLSVMQEIQLHFFSLTKQDERRSDINTHCFFIYCGAKIFELVLSIELRLSRLPIIHNSSSRTFDPISL